MRNRSVSPQVAGMARKSRGWRAGPGDGAQIAGIPRNWAGVWLDGCSYASKKSIVVIGIQHVHQLEIDEIFGLQSLLGMDRFGILVLGLARRIAVVAVYVAPVLDLALSAQAEPAG